MLPSGTRVTLNLRDLKFQPRFLADLNLRAGHILCAEGIYFGRQTYRVRVDGGGEVLSAFEDELVYAGR